MPTQTPTANHQRRADDHDALRALITENLATDPTDRDW